MDLILTKALPLAVYPVGLTILLTLLGVLVGLRWRWSGRVIVVAAMLWLWVAAMPATSNWLIGTLEERYPTAPADTYQEADVVVLLGGLAWTAPAPGNPIDFTDAVDRALFAADIYQAGVAPVILISGGNLPWADAALSEAELIADLLIDLGVPEEGIVLESESLNTRENAVNSAAILKARGWETALLVTSAWHMPRAVDAFAVVGVEVVPAPADARRRPLLGNVLDWLPDSLALATTTIAIKEWVGRIVYALRGWI